MSLMGFASIQGAISIGFIFPILSGFFTCLRFYTRWRNKTGRQVDDWLCIPAWLCLTGCCAALLTGVLGGGFEGKIAPSPSSVSKSQRLLAQTTIALELFYLVGNALVKFSVLFFYRRIFIGRAFNICTWSLMGITIVWLAYAITACILDCGINIRAEVEGGWGSCPAWGFVIQVPAFILNSCIDLAVLILPVPFLWKLQLSLSRKIGIAIVFLLWGFAFVASLNNTIIQLTYLTHPDTIVHSSQEPSSFFQGPAPFYIWPPVELGVGLIACNLPSLGSRAATSLPRRFHGSWTSSRFGFRHVLSKLSFRSESQKKSSHPNTIESKPTPITLNRRKNNEPSIDHLEGDDIPLVP